jgi:sec-independent protein translocase protein TatC
MFYKFFLEIKNRFFLIFLAWITTLIITYIYKEILLFLIIKPILQFSNIKFSYFIFTNLTEVFSTYIELIYFISYQTLYIYIYYHIYIFIIPSIYDFEYKILKMIFLLGIFFGVCSIIFLHKFLLPISWNFFLSFQEVLSKKTLTLFFEAKLSEYVNFYIFFYYICYLNFQIFVFIFIFFNYINKQLKTLKNLRKIFYFLFFFLATIFTPPDIISQIIFGLNMIIIFEILIVSILFKNVIKLNLATN